MSLVFEHTEVQGFEPALRGMRNPLDSWSRSDSRIGSAEGEGTRFVLGDADRDLCRRLIEAGPEHAKFLRQIVCWTDIAAPRFWWIEFDTYRFGVEKNSCSTMHTIMKKPLSEEDFGPGVPQDTVAMLNRYRDAYRLSKSETEKKCYWRMLIEQLPQSYWQKRTVMMSYQAIRNICRQRRGHKLYEWQEFIEWADGLPESWMLFDKKEDK